MASLAAAKGALRRQVKAAVAAAGPEERASQSRRLVELCVAHPAYGAARRLALFVSLPDEPDTTELLRHALAAGKTCFIPRYDPGSRDMAMVRLSGWQQYLGLPVTAWGVRQPGDDAPAEAGPLDLVVVPGLAFTRAGDRLGRGKGYYDTYLAAQRTAHPSSPQTTLALALREQLVPTIPTDVTDVRIQHVLCADDA